ncbi:MAG: hypothetical protein E7625_03570 [Ruminococcaceae bacterium]|nr:hypothetical protein [Oscillospiraceae bacterium]
MLTNNKKSTFIKSIAMIMAVLMVLAVALTGCGNKAAEEAANKADQAQNTATEAKTIAEKIAADLAAYLKIEEAVKVAEIEKMITDALGAHPTKDDLLAYVKNEDMMTAINDKIATVITADQVAAQITKALEDYATSAGMTEAINAAKTELNGKIAEEVAKVNKNNEVKALQDKATKLESDLVAAKAALEKADKDNKAALQAEVDAVDTALANAKKALEDADKKLTTDIAAIAADYLKAADKTALEALIAANTTKATALQAQVDALSTKLDTEVTKLATKAAVEAAVAELKAADAEMAADIAQLQEIVYQILSAILPQEEVETLTGEEADFGELLKNWDATTITAAISKKWSLEEWNTTTPKVIAAIEDIQDLLEKLYAQDENGKWIYAYTEANKIAVDNALAPLNIEIFLAGNEKAEYDYVAKIMEYTFLRVANGDDLDALYAAVDAANKVPTFADEMDWLLNGTIKEDGTRNEDGFVHIGHTHDFDPSDKVEQLAQVVTIADIADYNAFTWAFDVLVSKYLTDDAFDTTIYEDTYGKQAIMYVWEHPTTGKQIVSANNKTTGYATNDDGKKETGTNGNEVVWKYVGITILVDDEAAVWKKVNQYGIDILPSDIAEFKCDLIMNMVFWNTLTEGSLANNYGGEQIKIAKDPKNYASVYAALTYQLQNCVELINTAKATFKAFLKDVVKADGVLADTTALNTMTTITRDQYLEALTIEMCTAIVGGKEYDLYLTGKVQADMEKAVNRNTCEGAVSDTVKNAINANGTTDNDYQLYLDMINKVAGKMFEIYQLYAIDLLEIILNDYQSVRVNVGLYTTLPQNGVWEKDLGVKAEAVETEGFLAAFLNGAKFEGWSANPTADAKNALTVAAPTFDVLKNYYKAGLNGVAGTAYIADPIVTIRNNDQALLHLLNSAVIGVRDSIEGATFEANGANANSYKVFATLLTNAVANLEEVYARFLFEDYKKIQINTIYNYATERANLFSGEGDTALIAAMQDYLVGAKAGDNTLFPGCGLANGSLAADLKGAKYTVDPETEIIEWVNEIDKLVPVAKAEVEKLIDAYELMLDEMAIKRNFLAYLETATMSLQEIYYNYRTISGLRYALKIELSGAYNAAKAEIDMVKYQVESGKLKIGAYRDAYTKVLAIVFDKVEQKAHVDALLGAGYIEAQEKLVKSNEAHDYLTGANELKKPAANNYLGSAVNGYTAEDGTKVKGFDEIANTDTKYSVTTGTGASATTVIYKLYE